MWLNTQKSGDYSDRVRPGVKPEEQPHLYINHSYISLINNTIRLINVLQHRICDPVPTPSINLVPLATVCWDEMLCFLERNDGSDCGIWPRQSLLKKGRGCAGLENRSGCRSCSCPLIDNKNCPLPCRLDKAVSYASVTPFPPTASIYLIYA